MFTSPQCGYDVSANLAAKHKRSTDSRRTSKTRKALFDETFLTGMIGKLDEIHCQRYSTQEIKCWNGTTVGLFTGSRYEITLLRSFTALIQSWDLTFSLYETQCVKLPIVHSSVRISA